MRSKKLIVTNQRKRLKMNQKMSLQSWSKKKRKTSFLKSMIQLRRLTCTSNCSSSVNHRTPTFCSWRKILVSLYHHYWLSSLRRKRWPGKESRSKSGLTNSIAASQTIQPRSSRQSLTAGMTSRMKLIRCQISRKISSLSIWTDSNQVKLKSSATFSSWTPTSSWVRWLKCQVMTR